MPVDPELEEAITEAVRSPTDPHYDRVLSLLPGRELYMRLPPPEEGRQTLEAVTAGPLRCARFFTTRTHPLLGAPFGGIPWKAALTMLAKLPDVTGVMVVNNADDWVVFSKEHLLQPFFSGQQPN